MEASKERAPSAPAPAPRHFREQEDDGDEHGHELRDGQDRRRGQRQGQEAAALPGESPLEVNMTDEPGGDPYNHTGSFRRIFR